MNRPAILELDELDLMLAKELEQDARQSNRVLAGKLDISESTVKRRLQRLLDEGVITFTVLPYVLQLELPIVVIIGLSVDSGKADEVINYLRPNSNIQRIYLTTGRYDIVLLTMLKDECSLTDFFDGELCHVPHLRDAERILCTEVIKSSWKYLNGDTSQYQRLSPREFDEMDIRLIKEIKSCPRESIKDLSEKLGVHRKLVSRKLQSLLANNFIRVVSIAKPSYFGLNVQVFILVKVRPGNVRSVAMSLIAEKRVYDIGIITGQFEILLTAVFRDLEEMSDFLRNSLGNYEGVLSHETLIQIGLAKHSYSELA